MVLCCGGLMMLQKIINKFKPTIQWSDKSKELPIEGKLIKVKFGLGSNGKLYWRKEF